MVWNWLAGYMFLVRQNNYRDLKVICVSVCRCGTLGRSYSILDLEIYPPPNFIHTHTHNTHKHTHIYNILRFHYSLFYFFSIPYLFICQEILLDMLKFIQNTVTYLYLTHAQHPSSLLVTAASPILFYKTPSSFC